MHLCAPCRSPACHFAAAQMQLTRMLLTCPCSPLAAAGRAASGGESIQPVRRASLGRGALLAVVLPGKKWNVPLFGYPGAPGCTPGMGQASACQLTKMHNSLCPGLSIVQGIRLGWHEGLPLYFPSRRPTRLLADARW